MTQPTLFGGRPAPPIQSPWSIGRCRRDGREVGGYRGGIGQRTTFGYIRGDGVYQRGTKGIDHMVYRGWMSYGSEEWRASADCPYLVTVDNTDHAWWWIERAVADANMEVRDTLTGHRILVPLYLHGEVAP